MVLIFKKGQDFLEELKKSFVAEGINSGFFYGLGAFGIAELAFYDLDKKEYLKKKFKDGPFEVLNLTGNVAMSGDELIVHCHVTLGRRDYSVFGGHLISATVGGALEIFFESFGSLNRKFDKGTRLNLLS